MVADRAWKTEAVSIAFGYTIPRRVKDAEASGNLQRRLGMTAAEAERTLTEAARPSAADACKRWQQETRHGLATTLIAPGRIHTITADRAMCRSEHCGMGGSSNPAHTGRTRPGVLGVHGGCQARQRTARNSEEACRMASKRTTAGPTSCAFIAGACAECGDGFVVLSSSRAHYCSDECKRRHVRRRNKQVRRARLRSLPTEPISLTSVAERDGWRCHICKRKVARSTWSLDHLLPISAGGSHTHINVALAHHRCNTLRSNTGAAQLRRTG